MKSTSIAVPTISYGCARDLVSSAIKHAKENGWHVAVVVLDPGGQVVASARMDGVAPPILDYAADKAFTATLGKTTTDYFERMNSDPSLTMGAANRPRLCAWDGGLPIFDGSDLIGAIGVSGAAGDEDITCGEAACRSVGVSNRAA